MTIKDSYIQIKKLAVSILFLLIFPGIGIPQSFKTTSVLMSGSWYKIKVAETGIYQISYDDLRQIGIDAPQNIRIYGMPGKQLSYSVMDEDLMSGLEEIPLYNSSDNYYLFYAEGVENVLFDSSDAMFKQEINDYSLWNYLFITSSFGPGKRIENRAESLGTPDYSTSSYDYVSYIEKEDLNLVGSGRLWFKEIDPPTYTERFSVPDVVQGSGVKLNLSMAVRAANPQQVQVKANNNVLDIITFSGVSLSSYEGIYARLENREYTFSNSSTNIDIQLEFNISGVEEKVYLDYITLNARRSLSAFGDAMLFRDQLSIGNDVAEYSISNTNSGHQVWNITDYTQVFRVNADQSGGVITFKDEAQTLQEYVLVNVNGNFQKPVLVDEVNNDVGNLDNNQNLHELTPPELLIVTHPDFKAQAVQLANIHRNFDDMNVAVVTTTQVYNEFSSGRPEAGAIRNLAQMLFERSAGTDSLKYLLLFGDGSYDNRTNNGVNPNYIPTFQSVESLAQTGTYVSDDFYAKLIRGETISSGEICIGVGRLPVNSEEEAQAVVNKILQYYDPANMGDWRNSTIFLGDDGEYGWDNNIFMRDSDDLIRIINEQDKSFNHNKIFLDAYQQISSSTGASYPDVEEALDEAFKKGALLFNYMGHGGEEAITQEYVMSKNDFENLSNGPHYPIFVTATCQLSRYDNVGISNQTYSKRISAGEVALLNPDGGAIALLTTTRLVYQTSNKRLSNNIYKYFFDYDYKGDRYKLGDIYRLAKNASGSDVNTLKFALLGDPAITIPYGKYKVITDSINSVSVTERKDTLKALGEIYVTGYIAEIDSTILSDFNGKVYVSVFDKSYTVTTLGNDDIPIIDFEVQDKLLFRGLATVKDGRFSYSFKVPKDISYNIGEGKISYYADNGDLDAKGYYDGFYIGGTTSDPDPDFEGPEIRLFMNDERFTDGGITDANPILIAQIYDTNGINTTGNGIGHDLLGVLDGKISEGFVLNDYYIGAIDDYRRGQISYPLSDLESGNHTIMVRVWDTYNNSSEETISFYVNQSDNLAISELFTYPNPAATTTAFQYSHNSPGEEHAVTIEIFDAAGRVVHRIEREFMESGYVSEPIYWNFSISGGSDLLAPGVYPYRLTVNTSEGKNGIESGRLIIIP